MKNSIAICLASAVMAVACPVWGQEPAPQATPPQLPPGPLIQKKAPAFSEWTVIVSSSGAEGGVPGSSPAAKRTGGAETTQAASPSNKTTLITKTGDLRREVSVDANGRTTTYYVHDMQVITTPNNKTPVLIGLGSDSSSRRDFSGFNWISEKNFTSITKVQGRDCLIFRGESTAAEQEAWQDVSYGAGAPVLPAIAVIDLETRLPFSVKIGDETRTFRFANPPSAPLTLPADVKALIDERQRRLKSVQLAPP